MRSLVSVGDSSLIIDFCKWRVRLKVQELPLAVEEIGQLRQKVGGSVRYHHLDRCSNQLADWLTNVARVAEGDVDCTMELHKAGVGPFSLPPQPVKPVIPK